MTLTQGWARIPVHDSNLMADLIIPPDGPNYVSSQYVFEWFVCFVK